MARQRNSILVHHFDRYIEEKQKNCVEEFEECANRFKETKDNFKKNLNLVPLFFHIFLYENDRSISFAASGLCRRAETLVVERLSTLQRGKM